MTKSKISLLGSLFVAGALAAAGCGGGSSSGTGGKGGSGTGGKAATGGMTGSTGGSGGKAATGGMNGSSGGVTGTGGKIDAGPDSGTGGSTVDAHGDTGPCTTSFPNGTVEFAFDQGANLGWTGGTEGDVSSTTVSIGGSTTEGSKCPGAISMFVTYGSYVGQKVTLVYNHNNPPLDWTGHSKAHFWVKLEASSYSAINGVQPYVQSHPDYSNYKSFFAGTSTFSDGGWHEVVVDISTSDLANIVQFGVQVQFVTPADGGASGGGSFTLFVDDIWIENTPAPDAGPDVQPDVAPVIDATVDTTVPIDTGVDTTSG